MARRSLARTRSLDDRLLLREAQPEQQPVSMMLPLPDVEIWFWRRRRQNNWDCLRGPRRRLGRCRRYTRWLWSSV